jgi:hypothetical protein
MREGKDALCQLKHFQPLLPVHVQQRVVVRRVLQLLPRLLCFLARIGYPFLFIRAGFLLAFCQSVSCVSTCSCFMADLKLRTSCSFPALSRDPSTARPAPYSRSPSRRRTLSGLSHRDGYLHLQIHRCWRATRCSLGKIERRWFRF